MRRVSVDPVEAQRIQEAVDAGHIPGRRDPVDTALTYVDAEFGPPVRSYTLLSQQDYQTTTVRVEKNSSTLLVKLEKLVRKDAKGAWFVTEVGVSGE